MAAHAMALTQGMDLLFDRRQTVSQGNDSHIGEAQKGDNPSASQLLSTLAPIALQAAIWLVVFIIIRPRAQWKFSPRSRSRLLHEATYTPPLSNSWFSWIGEFWAIPDTYVMTHQSLDSYLFLRFLKMSVVSCVVGCCITWPVLFPVNATGGGEQKQLNILTMANVQNPWKFWAHAGCAILFYGFILFMITRESIFYINLRQAYLMNPAYANKLSSRTVLFTAVPDEYLDETRLREVLGPAVVRVWLPTDTSDLDDMVVERQKIAMNLEGAETKLIRAANAARLKSLKKGGSAAGDEQAAVAAAEAESGSTAARWITPKERPTHRLKPIIGKKVDSINWCRNELATLIPKVEAEQEKHRTIQAKKLRAAFVEFTNLREAQAAYQSLTHHQVLNMAPRFTGMHPTDIIWPNLRIRGWERYMRFAATTTFVVALVVFWSIPVAVVGVISNVPFLTDKLPWLRWLNKIPSVIMGVITGLLPAVMLAVLMALLPPVLRLAAKLGGSPTHSNVELTLQNSYFAFQVVQVFLVASLTSAATSVVTTIVKSPGDAPKILSENLPKASNFYLSYFIVQGLGVFAVTLVGLAGLFVTPLLVKLLGNTPRKIFMRWNQLSTVSWGVLYPVYTCLFVIAMCYAIIAPLVIGFAAIGLFLFYFGYRYNFLYVYDRGIDEKGLGYPRALQQLFVGLYISEICIFGLFATRLKDSKGAIGPFVLIILLLVFTALYHISLNSALGPLINYLPKTLEAEERVTHVQDSDVKDGAESGVKKDEASTATNPLSQPTHPKPNILTKFFKPHIYNDYATMRRLVPAMVPDDDQVDEGLLRDAYLPPSVWDELPTLLIPSDEMGVSAQEVAHTRKVTPITDKAATLDDKNKIVLNNDELSAAYFNEKLQKFKNMGFLSNLVIAG